MESHSDNIEIFRAGTNAAFIKEKETFLSV